VRPRPSRGALTAGCSPPRPAGRLTRAPTGRTGRTPPGREMIDCTTLATNGSGTSHGVAGLCSTATRAVVRWTCCPLALRNGSIPRAEGAIRKVGRRGMQAVERRAYQAGDWVSRKNPPIGPSAGRVAAQTTLAALSSTGRAPLASDPGQVAGSRVSCSSSATASAPGPSVGSFGATGSPGRRSAN
jgi:hypothetical protein